MEKESAIKVLHLEDNPSDAKLVQTVLSKANIKFEYFFADNEQDYRSILNDTEIDLILSDYNLPDYSGSDALIFAKNNYPLIPFVFISGAMGEDAAIESLLNGATDYVLKNKMERLIPAVHRAISETKEMKARIKAEKEIKKLSRAIEQSPNSIVITDIAGNIEYVNPKAAKLTGYSSVELIGKNPRIFSSGEKSKEEYAHLWETISSGNVWEGEFHNKRKNGSLYWESVSISPIIGNNGIISHYLAIKVDVSERKKLIEQLIQAKDRAEESDRLKTSFLHNISHEIRTPMNAIIGFSSFLEDPDLVPDKRKYFIDIIGQSCNQLLSIITDIVSIATIEAGQEKIAEKDIDLSTLMTLLYEQFLIKAKIQNLELILEIPESDKQISIVSDETKIFQVLTNLIGNALKFTKQGNITFGYEVMGNDLEFFVKDTGIGIDPDMYQVVFERFRQVESTTTRQFGGSGLGLSIAKAYVNLLGGAIWVDSELEKGSTFFFKIPLKRSEKKSIVEKESVDNKIVDGLKTKTILVAEDEESNFMLLEELLQALNVVLIRAINGIEAVEACKSNNHIDLVLMDIKMPIMDGYEAMKQIRELKHDLPILAQTAYSDETEKRKALSCGCNDFITKPFKKDILLAKVMEHLYGPQSYLVSK